ncbi:MAG: hypothetical protein KQH83_07950 [Actinobacteria bacterium]|nr:hypothetical protein [Actinomycetota bacterium]
MGARRWAAVAAAAVVLAAACGDGGGGEGGASTSSAAGTTEGAVTTQAPVTTAPAAVSGEAATGTMVLLADDFQDGDLAGWDVDDGWYLYGTGTEYLAAAGGAAWMWWPGGEDWPDAYALRSSVRIDRGGLAVSIAVGPEGRYVLHLHEDGTDLLLDRPWGTFTTLASGAPVAAGAWHALVFGCDGSSLQAYVDGQPLLAAEAGAALPGGSVGFGALDGAVAGVDNVLVTRLQAGLPAFPGVAAPAPGPAAAPPAVAAPPEPPGEEPEGPGAGDPADLEIDGIVVGARVVEGEAVFVQFSVTNRGGTASGPFSVAWEAAGSACTAGFPSLEPMTFGVGTCEAAGLPSGLHTWTAYADDDDRVAESDEADNTRTGVIEVAAAWSAGPDLHIVDGNPGTIQGDEQYTFWVIVDDLNGTGFDRAFTTRFLVDGRLACSVDETGAPVQVFCDLPRMAAGVHVVETQIDPEDEIAETREDNNTWTWEAQVEGGRPDLRFVPAPSVSPPAGAPFDVAVTVEDHNGSGFQGSFSVRFSVDGRTVCDRTASGVPATLTCTYPALAAGEHEFSWMIDPADAVDETIEHNNEYTVRRTAG